MGTDRRTFLKGAAGAATAVGVGSLLPSSTRRRRGPRDATTTSRPARPVDRVVRTTCSPNCTGSCGQLAFVRDGIVVKIQQAADYPDGGLQPARLHEGPLVPSTRSTARTASLTPLIRTGRAGQRRVPRGDLGGGARQGRRRAQAASARRGAGTRSTCSGRCRARATSRRAPTTGPRAAGHEPRHELRLQRRPADGHADHVRRPERRARGEGLGEQPVPAAASARTRVETRIPDVHFIFDAARARRPPGRRRPQLLRRRPPRPTPSCSIRRRAPTPRFALGTVPPGHRGRGPARPGVHAHLHGRAAAGARRHRRAPPRGGPRRRAGAGPVRRVGRRHRQRPVIVGIDRLGFRRRRRRRRSTARSRSRWPTARAGRGLARVRARAARSSTAGRPSAAAEVTGLDPEHHRQGRPRLRHRASPRRSSWAAAANHWYHGDLTGRAFALLAALTGNIGRLRRRASRSTWASTRCGSTPAPWWNPGGTKAHDRPLDLLRPRPRPRRCTPTCPTRSSGWQGPRLHVRQHVRAGDGREPAARDARRARPRRRRRPPEDRDREVGRHRAARDDVVREDRPHRHAAAPVPAAPAGGDRAGRRVPAPSSWMWREIMRRIDPAKAGRVLRARRGRRRSRRSSRPAAAGRPHRGHHPRAARRPGPVRLKVPDPDVPFLAPDPRTWSRSRPVSLPAPLEATAAFLPTRPHRVLQGGGRGSASWARPCPPTGRRSTTASTTRRRGRSRCSRRTEVAHPLVVREQRRGCEEIHGGRPEVLSSRHDAAARGIGDRRRDPRCSTPAARSSAWAQRDRRPPQPGTVTLHRGLVAAVVPRGQGASTSSRRSAVNPIHEVHFVANMWAPSTGWKDCRCEMRRA